MSIFIPKERIPVTVDGGVNTIYIRPKLDVGAQMRIRDAGNIGGGGNMLLGAATLVVLAESIIDWDGPMFVENGVKQPCTRSNIERMDPDDPLVERVAEEVAARVERKAITIPNLLNGGGKSSRASSKKTRASMTST